MLDQEKAGLGNRSRFFCAEEICRYAARGGQGDLLILTARAQIAAINV